MQGFGQTFYIFNKMLKAFQTELANTYVH